MTPEIQMQIRCQQTTRDRFYALHEQLGNKKLSQTLDSLLKANASGGEKALRVVELEAQIQNIDEAFKQAMRENTSKLNQAQEKVNRAAASRKAAHNKYHSLIRYIQRKVPRQVLANLDLSKFMETPQTFIETETVPDDVGEHLGYLSAGEPEK